MVISGLGFGGLNSLNGANIGDYIGEFYEQSLDYSSYYKGCMLHLSYCPDQEAPRRALLL